MSNSLPTSIQQSPGFPEITKDLLIDLGGWDLFKEAKSLVQGKIVKEAVWEPPILKGKLRSGAGIYHPRIDLKRPNVPTSECNCRKGQYGMACVHAVTLAFHVMLENQAKVLQKEEKEILQSAVPIKSFKVSPNGKPFFLRFLLPPNLAQVAPRDAIALRIQAYQGNQYGPPEKFKGPFALSNSQEIVAALLESWSGGKVPAFLQLDRQKLTQLIAILAGEPAFAWVKTPLEPIPWDGLHLPGVSEFLQLEKLVAPEVPQKTVAKTERTEPRVPVRSTGSVPQVEGSPHYLAIQLPSKDSYGYDDLLDLLKLWGFRLEPSNRQWWLRDRFKTLKFLSQHWDQLENEFGSNFSDGFHQRMANVQRVKPRTKVTKTRNGEFDLELQLKAGNLDDTRIHQALISNSGFVEDEESEAIYLFDEKLLEPLKLAQQTLTNEPDRDIAPRVKVRLRSADLHNAEEVLDTLPEHFKPPEEWKLRSAALKDMSQLQQAPVSSELDAMLRNYQRIGVAWLWHLYQQRIGGILADEMGLGKTVQALAFLQSIRNQQTKNEDPGTKNPEPFLVVCPASLCENWRREAARFVPEFKVLVQKGTKRTEKVTELEAFDLIILSYPLLVRDLDLMRQIDYACIIGDEGQHIKNPKSQVAKAMFALRAEGRFLLTGTPIENSLGDLRSLFQFLMPGYLARIPQGLKPEDRKWFGQRHLSQAAPYILRRSKSLVAPELPEVIEQVLYCEMGDAQKSLYNQVHKQTEQDMDKLADKGANEARMRMAVFAQILKLRQVCAEPRLLDDKLKESDSAKLEAFLEILDDALSEGHRILVFSQFVQVLKKIQESLEERDLRYCYLDGQSKDRMAQVDRFQQDEDIPVFLISLKAGGTGLNLTGANMVIHFDPWWNPAAEAQATARAHRIGQERKVTSIKLIAANTIEERVLHLQRVKQQIIGDLFDQSDQLTAKVGFADLQDLLSS
jgi:SNF2 family DNA or RNA helicase